MAPEDTGAAPDTQDAPAPAPTPEPTGQQNAQPSSTPGPAPAQKAEDDRNRGILADLQKERKARQALEARITQSETELAAERRRVQALAGVTPQSPEQADIDAIRDRLAQVNPWMAKLTDEKVEQLLGLLEQRENLEAATKHHWDAHSRQMLDTLTGEVEKSAGGKLTERQSKAVKQAYFMAVANDPALLARHDAGDTAFVKEFVKDWIDDWYEPARRQITAEQSRQFRPVPSGKDRNMVSQGERKIDVTDPKAVEDLLVAGFKERGGQFGR